MSSYIKLLISTQIGALPCNKEIYCFELFPYMKYGGSVSIMVAPFSANKLQVLPEIQV